MFLSSLGLLISLIFIFSILGILRPLKKFIVDQFEKNISLDTIVVKASPEQSKTSSLISLLRKKRDITLGITEEKISAIKSWEGVSKISQTQILQKPILGKFDHPVLSKMGIAFDLLLQGVSYDLVSASLKCMADFKPSYEITSMGEKIPVIPLVLPESFAEMAYAYTMMNGLPPVTKKNMVGLRLNLNIGQSVMNSSDDQKSGEPYIGVVCGFVPQNMVSVVGAPLEWVRNMHLRDRQIRAADSYDKIYIRVKNINDVNKIVERLTNYGFVVISGDNETYSKINKWLNRLDVLLWSFVAILLLISAISLSNSFMILTTQKRYEFGLYLVFGASPLFLWILIFIEGAFWGAFHSSIAYFIAKNFSHFLQQSMQVIPWASQLYQGNITFDFTITFAEKWYLIIGSILFAGISSLIPAIIMTGRKTLSLVKKD
jgi:ABC-type antimicrobial peptide transport system permease subunit